MLAQGRPADLVAERNAPSLEAAFIGYLEDAADKTQADGAARAGNGGGLRRRPAVPEPQFLTQRRQGRRRSRFSLARIWAFARREAIEISHDTVRLAFAVLGPLLLMIVFGYGISLDVEHLTFAVLDFDHTQASEQFADRFRGSIYYDEKPPIPNYAEMDRRLRNGELRFAVEIPSGFERDLIRGRQPTVSAYVDAAVPFRAETSRSYIESTVSAFDSQARRDKGLPQAAQPISVNVRALYNQSFDSIYAMVPGDVMLLLMLIPSMLPRRWRWCAKKELGSIANFYAAPASKAEFLLGEAVALHRHLAGPVRVARRPCGPAFPRAHQGKPLPTLALGGLVYVMASTGFGLLISVFAATQTAAIFAAAIITILPASQFSGMFVPVSSLSGTAAIAAKIFPSTYFQAISVGAFTKALGFTTLWPNIVSLAVIALVYFGLSVLLLGKQES